MPRLSNGSSKAERDRVRERMRAVGCGVDRIAEELSRRFRMRPRAAWRYALGWPQWKLAQEYNRRNPGARMSESRVSEFENWPIGGTAPSVRYIVSLASTYGNGCTPEALVDLEDLEQLDPADRCALVGRGREAAARQTQPVQQAHNAPDGAHWEAGQGRRQPVTVAPTREEVAMAADDSARFGRWSANTNVDADLLDQMQTDLDELAVRYLNLPPAMLFRPLVDARNQAVELITRRQPPKFTMRLYRVVAQACALLAHASADLGADNAAKSQARTARRCADYSDYTELDPYIVWVQSNVAFWRNDYATAANLVEAALRNARTASATLRLASQLARIEASRGHATQVRQALAVAEQAMSDSSETQPGVLAFPVGKAAYYASEACLKLGGPDDLRQSVQWATTAVNAFSTDLNPSEALVAAARFDLMQAQLASGQLDAVQEGLGQVIDATSGDHRTVPVISRAFALRETLTRKYATAPGSIGEAIESLDHFCSAPAVFPHAISGEVESGSVPDNPPELGR